MFSLGWWLLWGQQCWRDGHTALFEPSCLLFLSEIEEMAPFSPKVLTANQGHRVSCAAPRGVPTPQVWWERNQERVPTAGRVYQEAEQLVFTSITEADAGTYTCHAANKAGEKKQELSITVASRQLSEEGWEHWEGLKGWSGRAGVGCGIPACFMTGCKLPILAKLVLAGWRVVNRPV